MYAMRYGTVPIAHATGGLIDTIQDYNPFSKGDCKYLSVGMTAALNDHHQIQPLTGRNLKPSLVCIFVISCLHIQASAASALRFDDVPAEAQLPVEATRSQSQTAGPHLHRWPCTL